MFSENSIDYLRRSLKHRHSDRGPLDVQILPTTRCNAACTFCPLHAVPKELKERQDPRWLAPPEDLPLGLMDRLAEELYKLGGLKRLHITGGEPLLYKHLIPLIFLTRREFPNVEITLVTNGILLKDNAERLVLSRLDRLSVSLNAGSSETYIKLNPAAGSDTFDNIIEGIRAIKKAGEKTGLKKPYVSVTSVVTKENIKEAKDTCRICMEAGAGGVTFIPLMEFRRDDIVCNTAHVPGKAAFESFAAEVDSLAKEAAENNFYVGFAGDPAFSGVLRHENIYSRVPCYSGYTFAMIWPNGDVRPCCNCETLLGNLKQQSFSAIWTSEAAQATRDRMMDITAKGYPPTCDCEECGYIYENLKFHELVKKP